MNQYDDMRAAFRAELEQNSQQGDLTYIEPPTESGPEYNPVITPGAEHDVIGAKVSGKRKNEYIAGGYIQARDVLYRAAETGFTPELSGTFRANGTTYQIIMVDPITEEVPPVGWYLGLRA